MTYLLILLCYMNSISISQLKVNPSVAISNALDFPLAVENRNKVQAYILGKDLYEMIVSYIEDASDRKAVEETNFNESRDLETVVEELGL